MDDDDDDTTYSNVEQGGAYFRISLRLANTQNNSENNYLKLKKEYENGEKKLDELVESFKIYENATKAYITYIMTNEKVYKLSSSMIEHLLKNPLNEEKRYILQQQKKEAGQGGGKRKTKGKSKKVAKKPVVSQKKQSIYKEILGKQMKIYKMPDSRKEYVKYKGDLHLITDYKDLMKQKANAKPKAKPKPKK